MDAKYTIVNHNVDYPKPPNVIIVSNYYPENQIVNWGYTDIREGATRSDIGVWHVKYKNT